MRVLIVSAIYPPEPVISAQTSAQIAHELLCQRHEVRVITSYPNRPGGKLFNGYKRHFFQTDEVDGIITIRCFSFLSPKSTMLSRFLENASFGLTSALAVIFSKRPDIIYANTWPIFATGILWLIAKVRKIPLVLSVQDIYPESLVIQHRISQNQWISKVLRYIDGVIARRCQAVITISENFTEIYLKDRRVSKDRLYFVPNWVDIAKISSYFRTTGYRRDYQISDQSILLVYGGNIGVAAGVDTVIKSFSYLDGDFDLLIAGEGSNLERTRSLAKSTCPNRIHFHSPWSVEETLPLLRVADLLILPTQGSQSLSSVPSKLITYMLSARPIIALALPDSDIANVIKKANCGWVISPDQPQVLAEKLQLLQEIPEVDRSQLGQNGKDYALKNFSRDSCLPKVINIILEAANCNLQKQYE